MLFLRAVFVVLATFVTVSAEIASTTAGIEGLVNRRLGKHAGSFLFELVNATGTAGVYDEYTVSSISDSKILVQGSTVSALSTG